MLIVGLSGRKQSGKNTAATHLKEHFTDLVVWEFSFADYLKQTCRDLFGLSHSQCYGTDQDKSTPSGVRWSQIPGRNLNNNSYMTARELLQVWGTDIVRTMNPDAWVNATLAGINNTEGLDLALITDVRFPNEVRGIQAQGGKVIRLTRNPHPEDSHVSERALDAFTEFDAVVDNSAMSTGQQREPIIALVREWLASS